MASWLMKSEPWEDEFGWHDLVGARAKGEDGAGGRKLSGAQQHSAAMVVGGSVFLLHSRSELAGFGVGEGDCSRPPTAPEDEFRFGTAWISAPRWLGAGGDAGRVKGDPACRLISGGKTRVLSVQPSSPKVGAWFCELGRHGGLKACQAAGKTMGARKRLRPSPRCTLHHVSMEGLRRTCRVGTHLACNGAGRKPPNCGHFSSNAAGVQMLVRQR